ncbi:LADA_0E15016g1_1 [Lachancea dasiensis]|uniref:LADA_0E15016g1_1 n=1 Tax=Lachancea dasiensis TaxID=1072105 RepID=A0A1G4JGP8_9SACH|nr:LADA_0E15016g1_1 [Lachancea dasiensis]
MAYLQSFKNTFFVDALEYFRIVKEQSCERSNENSVVADTSSSIEIPITDKDLEVGPVHCHANEFKDPFLIEWIDDSDPDHPHNWSNFRKSFIAIEVLLLSCITYMGSSIYTPGQEAIQNEFGVGHWAGTLNLSLYVLGYGIGPIFLAPFSEFATIGRQHIYIFTLFAFVLFQIGCATVKNFGGLIVMRFISGVLSSPALSTGAASIADVIKDERKLPLVIGLWSSGAILAPIIAPLLGACMLVAEDWRYIFWLLTWMATANLITLIFFFPETSPENILYRRCKRIRKMTGDNRYYTIRQKEEEKLNMWQFFIAAVLRPFKIIYHERIVAYFDIYMALLYGSLNLFFESIPIVFLEIYHFSVIEMGVAYMGFTVGSTFGYLAQCIFQLKVINPKFDNGTFQPESLLLLDMALGWIFPVSMFIFGWGASVHWMLVEVALALFMFSVFTLFQISLAYLAVCYPRYVASVFAGSTLTRASFACAFPLFGTTMYRHLATEKFPVGWGSSVVGFAALIVSIVPFFLYKYGRKLRGVSAFAE